ncbi:phospholipase D-like domain-containing protein [Isoptericola croceus]|uniref:phospholipase D-like domain-containing protein n=1 Tax=Isoptericola croceus TaxID=3031406 RepID=UPI0023F7115B|nr:phospholipase D-like domain-containing protein [Isoptericola croceus]
MTTTSRKSIVSAALTTTLALALAFTTPPPEALADSGCSRSGAYETCFTDPPPGGEDRTIVHRLRELVSSTKRGDKIRVSMYLWNQTGIARDLVEAKDRGVNVQVVVDDAAEPERPYKILQAGGVPVRVCVDGCLGDKINHTKFFLLEIGPDRYVAQTSSNLTDSMLKRTNDLVIVKNNASIYEFYLGYWNRMRGGSWTHAGDTWSNSDRTATGSRVKAYAFPRTDFDVYLAILRNVTECRDGDKKIWVTASLFTGPREEVRNRLAYMEDVMGCNVKVLVRKQDHELWAQVNTSGGYNLNNSKVRRVPNLHNKILIIDAKYNGRWQETVITGSHNLTSPSLLRNEEAMLRIEDSFVFKRYRSYFDDLYDGSVSS